MTNFSVDHLISITEQFPLISALPEGLRWKHHTGESGTNREKHYPCEIHAQNDFEAIQCWLREYQQSPLTLRVYQKEVERFLLWSIFQRNKALSSLDREDLHAYFEFLDHPEPYAIWCSKPGGRSRKRGHTEWRPFAGPLNKSSKATAITCIRVLFEFLTAARYLAFNPFTIMRPFQQTKKTSFEEQKLNLQNRILERNEWQAILETLEAMPENTPHKKDDKIRLRFLVYILFFLGLRINELATHHWNAFRKVEDHWWFYVRGKGDKLARIPVNDDLLEAVKFYRQHLRFNSVLPQADEEIPLITNWHTGHALTTRQMNKLLKKLALQASKKFDDHPDKQKKLKRFSAHWLRHLSASLQDQAGITFKNIQENLRHTKTETTRLYIHASDQERIQQMSKLRLKSF